MPTVLGISGSCMPFRAFSGPLCSFRGPHCSVSIARARALELERGPAEDTPNAYVHVHSPAKAYVHTDSRF